MLKFFFSWLWTQKNLQYTGAIFSFTNSHYKKIAGQNEFDCLVGKNPKLISPVGSVTPINSMDNDKFTSDE
jgi:hypothetical protein